MNTDNMIKSKKALEDSINALVSEFQKEHNIFCVEVNSRTYTLRTGRGLSVANSTEINVTATINEDGVEIIIR